VWIRHHDGTDEVVICALDDGGPVEVARHRRTTPGSPAIDDSHFPAHRDKIPGDYRIRARATSEQVFLALGPGAAVWLKEAAALGTERMIQKMAHAVELSVLGDRADVDWALGHAATHGRFATGDLDSILAHKGLDPTRRGASEDISLAQGTRGWNLLGTNIIDTPAAAIARACGNRRARISASTSLGSCAAVVVVFMRCLRHRGRPASVEPVWSRPRVISRRRLRAAVRWCSQWSFLATPR
jgi:hypothetical protein